MGRLHYLCEQEGQLDLARFKAQWLDRAGAPSLRLEDLDWENGHLRSRVRQVQGCAAYELDIPLLVECHDGTVKRERLLMGADTLDIDLACPEPRRVALDPAFDLFRLLDGREVEATVGLVMGEEDPLFLAPRAWLLDLVRREALQTFASALRDLSGPEWMALEDYDPAILAKRSVIGVNLAAVPEGLEASDLRLSDAEWGLAGESGQRMESSLVLSLKSLRNDRKGALLFWVPGPEALPALARKVPHYGKYSYLAFDSEGINQLKGNMAPRGNSLERRFGGW